MIIHDAQKHIFRLQGPSYSYHLTVQDGVLLRQHIHLPKLSLCL